MEIQGIIVKAGDTRSGMSSRGNWMSQEFIIEHGPDQWKRHMLFEVFGADRLQRFAIKEGQKVNVSFDIDAHEYNGRWFNKVRAFDVRQVVETPTNIINNAPTEENTPFDEIDNI